jgi:hypothetical protein
MTLPTVMPSGVASLQSQCKPHKLSVGSMSVLSPQLLSQRNFVLHVGTM